MRDQCQLALRTILDALPEHGRLNARDVHWLRSVARAGLGEDPLGAELVTLETVLLRAIADAARAVVDIEWNMVDPQHRILARQHPDLLTAIRTLREALEQMEERE